MIVILRIVATLVAVAALAAPSAAGSLKGAVFRVTLETGPCRTPRDVPGL